MALQKRIGIIACKIHKHVNRHQLCGILTQAYSMGFSADVFNLNEEFYDDKVTQGELNLLRLINPDLLDGILYLPYSFSSPEIQKSIERYLTEQWDKAVAVITSDPTPFPAVWYDDCTQMSEMVSHLIQRHGCKEILCLTGPAHMDVASRRLEGYQQAMTQAGLSVPEEAVIFGDFWVPSAEKLAKEIADGSRPMPDAVACANDSMAVALCDALKKYGISVPEDIRITGYDGTLEAHIHVPTVTTYHPSWRQLGISAMCRLYEEITGEAVFPCVHRTGRLECGESCGCISDRTEDRPVEFNYEKMEEGYRDSSLSTRLLAARSYNSFIREVYALTDVFMQSDYPEKTRYALCLCEDWNRTELHGYTRTHRTEGYSENMLLTNPEGQHIRFPSRMMIPPQLQTPAPSVTFFTASHFRNRCFGYSLLTFEGAADSFDVYYMRFCREVDNALAFLSMQNELKSLSYRRYISEIRDELTGLYLLENSAQIWEEMTELSALYGEDIYLIAISVGGLQQAEDAGGRIKKDKLIVAFADMLSKGCSGKEKVFRVRDDSFAVIGSHVPPLPDTAARMETLAGQFRQYSLFSGNSYPLQIGHDIRVITGAEICSAETAAAIISDMLDGLEKISQPPHSSLLHYRGLAALRREIYQFPEKEWNLPYCCRKMNISRSYFQKIYHSAFGVSCVQDIQQSKLNFAKKLLIQTNDTLQSIAEKCGYDYAHFMRVFKKETGVTPTEYRRGKRLSK